MGWGTPTQLPGRNPRATFLRGCINPSKPPSLMRSLPAQNNPTAELCIKQEKVVFLVTKRIIERSEIEIQLRTGTLFARTGVSPATFTFAIGDTKENIGFPGKPIGANR